MGAGGSSNNADKFFLGDTLYTRMRLMGTGAFGWVYAVVETQQKGGPKIPNPRWFALKQMSKKKVIESKQTKVVMMENEILKNINSPFIANLHYALQTDQDLILFLDLKRGGDLRYQIEVAKHLKRPFMEDTIRFYAASMLLGIEHLHEKSIVHRDLKPDNVLLDEAGYPSLIDFNVSAVVVEPLRSKCGTFLFMAPEVLKEEAYGLECDLWSYGVMLYEIAYLIHPYFNMSDPAERKKLEDIAKGDKSSYFIEKIGNYNFPCQHALPKIELSAVFKDFILKILKPASSRASIKELKAHDFLKPVDWNGIINHTVKPGFVPPQRAQIDQNMIMKETEARRNSIHNPQTISAEEQEQFLLWNWARDGSSTESKPYSVPKTTGKKAK